MTISDLVPGATYLIRSTDSDGSPWLGKAIYLKPEISGSYPDGCGYYQCEDGQEGVFRTNEIICLVADSPKLLSHWVSRLLASLSEKRDWLDPEIERNLRELVDSHQTT